MHVQVPAQDSRSAHGLLYLAAVRDDRCEPERYQGPVDIGPRLTFAMLTFSLPPGKDSTCCCQHNHDGYVTSEEAQIESAIADKPTNAKSEQ